MRAGLTGVVGILLLVAGCQQPVQTPAEKGGGKKVEVEKNLSTEKGEKGLPAPVTPTKEEIPKGEVEQKSPPPTLVDFQDNFSQYSVGANPPFGPWEGKNSVIAQFFQPDNTPGNVVKFNSGIICNFQKWGDFNLTANYKTFTIGVVSVDLKTPGKPQFYQIDFHEDGVEVDYYLNPFQSKLLFQKSLPDLQIPPNEWMELGVQRQGSLVKISVNGENVAQLKLANLKPEEGVYICFEGDGIEGALLDNVEIVGYQFPTNSDSTEKE
jgi:hypothetical protein